MYQIGDHVVYGIHGVCCIRETEERIVDRKRVEYYVLEPIDGSGTRYLIPTGNQAALGKLQPVLSREALEALLHSDEVRADAWIADEGQRKQTYRELINSGDRAALIRMVGTLRRHREAQVAAGRKFHLCDDNFLRDAERLLVSEAAIVLETDQEQAKQYIRTKLEDA